MTTSAPLRNPTTVSTPLPAWLAGVPAARRTRIVCTLGPASQDAETLRGLIAAGMDVARFNFSHGSHDFHRRLAATVREAAAEVGRPVALMQDLQGPKLRIGTLPAGPLDLIAGGQVELRAGSFCDGQQAIPVPHRELVRALVPGDRVLFADGEIQVAVVETRDDSARCEVVLGGVLGDRKGITVPGRHFRLPVLTRRDAADLAFGRLVGFDYLALSFVRTGSDLDGVRRICRAHGWSVPLVAKLETQEALWNLDAILAASDAVMVARGDLGIQLPLAEVPAAQKEIISAANRAGVPVITATQMLESMVTTARPTRAEATDVANAVWDGTDAVMLSAETSAGRHPVESVHAMSELCLAAEQCDAWRRSTGAGWPRAGEG